MPRGVHKNPFLGWNPPVEDSAWAREEAGRRGVKLSTILTEALSDYRAKHQGRPASPPRARKPREDIAPAARFVAAEEPRPQPAPRRHAATCKCGICRPKKEGQ
jgi:hypothetical protein